MIVQNTLNNESDAPIMISALEHWSYCPRQCALIHVEQTFEENLYTMRGQAVHQNVDKVESTYEHGVCIERALPLWSKQIGLVGKADVVEFHSGIPYPVEHKHGPRKSNEHDDLQVCAQALCLEEMTGQAVLRGAIYHYKSRRRREVIFDEHLRAQVVQTVAAIRTLYTSTSLPSPVHDQRCDKCSLKSACMPEMNEYRQRQNYLLDKLFNISDSGE